MGGNQDARPFVDLLKDAEEFRQKFDADIKKCMSFLDVKITALICDPDTLASPSRKSAVKQNALVEFSKAKYDIFIGVKTLMNEMEREWLKYISEMKKLFIENVEIFLAGTKLEVKLPVSEFQTSPGFKKSPRKEKSSITDSLYPIINSFAKNMAALGSPLRNKESRKSPKEVLEDSCLIDKEISDDESDNEDESVEQVQSGQLKRGSARVVLSKDNASIARATPPARNEVESSDSESGLNRSRQTPRSRGRQSNKGRLSNSERDSSPQDSASRERRSSRKEINYRSSPERDGSPTGSMSGGGRSGKETTSISSQDQDYLPPYPVSREVQSRKETNSSSSQERGATPQGSKSRAGQSRKETNSSFSQDRDASLQGSKSGGGRSKRGISSSSSQERDTSPQGSKLRGRRSRKETSTSSSQEHDTSQGSVARGRRSSRKEIDYSSSPERDVSPDVPEPKEDQSRKETKSSLSQAISTRKSKGRNSPKPVENKRQTRTAAKRSESEESEEVIEIESGTRPSRQRDKTPAKPTISASQKSSITSASGTRSSRLKSGTPAKYAAQKLSTTEESESESTKETPLSITKGRKGKTPAKHKPNSSVDNEPRSTRRGVVVETPVEQRSKSPKKVSFSPSYETNDLDVFTPNVKSKSSIRRKTLLPNLDEIASGADIIPGASRGRANKRKTIGGISDFISATPPKRLKVGESRKNISSNPVDDDADDNLLENDGDYSDWIPLKSIDGKIPTKPGVYEVKVWRAKKPAYIGHCESLRQKMTLHKLRQNSGHKHLDKFVERNMDDIQIRYEVMSSIDNAKSEAKNRVKNFVSQYKTTPAYN